MNARRRHFCQRCTGPARGSRFRGYVFCAECRRFTERTYDRWRVYYLDVLSPNRLAKST